jgi:hypothetical protein
VEEFRRCNYHDQGNCSAKFETSQRRETIFEIYVKEFSLLEPFGTGLEILSLPN